MKSGLETGCQFSGNVEGTGLQLLSCNDSIAQNLWWLLGYI
jgi:hypothetical protein